MARHTMRVTTKPLLSFRFIAVRYMLSYYYCPLNHVAAHACCYYVHYVFATLRYFGYT